MDFGKFHHKLILRTTSPVEYLYAVSSHPVLILFALALGTVVLYVVTSSEPTLYQATATLQINPNEPVIEPGSRTAQTRLDAGSFINDQVGILESDTVLLALVNRMGYDEVLAQADGGDEVKHGTLQRFYRDLADRLETVIGEFSQPPAGTPEEVRRQKAVRQFRRRSEIATQKESHNVRLAVRGTERENLVRELETWIDSYRQRIEDFTEESYAQFLTERAEYWRRIAVEKKQALDRFLSENPDVNQTMQRIVQEQIIRQQIFLDGLQNRLINLTTGLEGPQPENFHPPEPMRQDFVEMLKAAKREFEVERFALLGWYEEGSLPVKAHDEKIRRIDESIGALEVNGPPPEALDRQKLIADLLRKNIDHAKDELEKHYRRRIEIDGKLDEHEELLADYRYADDKVRTYERSMDWRMEFTEGQKLVQVQVWDKPTAGTDPINALKVLEVAYGALGGLSVGLLLAFGVEFFSRTIRFKRDVVEELGIPVIGVIPSK